MRIQVKGGVWKNTEDEILKAAVMKYGKNQWARISSLLVRKSAKQCKARWLEWLDPSIKKTEWSREEEEKLLHLAKIMPTQWRTIAPLVGRTSAQCLEHYEKLLDRAQNKEFGGSDDPRKLRPGEIDPNPESKPARPDPVDMDEDEKEMLSEARARLANTKGKKAKRKAREKQLEEARRLASLQKRRELKAAGIAVGSGKKKVKGIDYLKEIPFGKRPAPGFFDTAQEDATLAQQTQAKPFRALSLKNLDGTRASEEEERKRKDDLRKQKEKAARDLPAALMQVNKLGDPEQVRKRSKLSLPEPQLTERDLEDIAKLESGGGDASAELGLDTTAKNKATNALLTRYDVAATPASRRDLTTATPLRTPAGGAASVRGLARTPARTPARADTLLSEAQNILALHKTQTPLIGGENQPLQASDFSGATPQRAPVQTPNVLATPLRRGVGSTPAGAPASVARQNSVLRSLLTRTPVRDELKLNDEKAMQTEDSTAEEREKQKMLKRHVQTGLSALPEPKNEYQIVLPTVPADEEKEHDDLAPDAQDLIDIKEKQKKAAEEARLRERSTVLRRALTRPLLAEQSLLAPVRATADGEDRRKAEEMIRRELFQMIAHDNSNYPLAHPAQAPVSSQQQQAATKEQVKYSESELRSAEELVRDELQSRHASQVTADDFRPVAEHLTSTLVALLPKTADFADLSDSKADKNVVLAALQHEYERTKEAVLREAKRAAKLEQKLNIVHGGYVQVNERTRRELTDLASQLQQVTTEIECFKLLKSGEDAAGPQRIASLKTEVSLLAEREAALQARYAMLTMEKNALMNPSAMV